MIHTAALHEEKRARIAALESPEALATAARKVRTMDFLVGPDAAFSDTCLVSCCKNQVCCGYACEFTARPKGSTAFNDGCEGRC